MIIATYNVNSIRSRLPVVIGWLEKHSPAVLCMQETKVEDGKFPREAFESQGYSVVFRGEKRYSGVATVSLKKPDFLSAGFDDGGPPDEERLLRTDFGDLKVINVYVPQGQDVESHHFQYKLNWFKRLRNYLERHFSPADFVVLCGDLNVAREPIDVHDPKRLFGHVDFNPEVWAAYDTLLEWGLVDLFRKFHPGEKGQFTFYDYRVPNAVRRGLGWRVDHILTTPALAEHATGCWIDMETRLAEKPSDHTVLVAHFSLG